METLKTVDPRRNEGTKERPQVKARESSSSTAATDRSVSDDSEIKETHPNSAGTTWRPQVNDDLPPSELRIVHDDVSSTIAATVSDDSEIKTPHPYNSAGIWRPPQVKDDLPTRLRIVSDVSSVIATTTAFRSLSDDSEIKQVKLSHPYKDECRIWPIDGATPNTSRETFGSSESEGGMDTSEGSRYSGGGRDDEKENGKERRNFLNSFTNQKRFGKGPFVLLIENEHSSRPVTVIVSSPSTKEAMETESAGNIKGGAVGFGCGGKTRAKYQFVNTSNQLVRVPPNERRVVSVDCETVNLTSCFKITATAYYHILDSNVKVHVITQFYIIRQGDLEVQEGMEQEKVAIQIKNGHNIVSDYVEPVTQPAREPVAQPTQEPAVTQPAREPVAVPVSSSQEAPQKGCYIL